MLQRIDRVISLHRWQNHKRIAAGMVQMAISRTREYEADRTGAEISGQRGGMHNSVTRTVPKPTHMIGGYAQLAYGFNYYGTVGANRDEFVVMRKMKHVDWMDQPASKQD